MSLETLLEECADRGWLLNNLFQHDDASWQCNLRTATHYTSFARGPTAELALESAITAIESAEPFPEPAPTIEVFNTSFEPRSTQPASIDINTILRNLRPPTPAVFRRKL